MSVLSGLFLGLGGSVGKWKMEMEGLVAVIHLNFLSSHGLNWPSSHARLFLLRPNLMQNDERELRMKAQQVGNVLVC